MARYIFNDERCRYVDINKDTLFYMHKKLVDFVEKIENSGIQGVFFRSGQDYIELTIKIKLTILGEFFIFSSLVQDKLKDMHQDSLKKCNDFIGFFNSISGDRVYLYNDDDE